MVENSENIDRIIVVTTDDVVQKLAKSHGIRTIQIGVPGMRNQPNTLDETLSLIKKVLIADREITGMLLVANHRNLLLSNDDIRQAISVVYKNPGNILISLGEIRDHACQFRSFYNFVGCELLEFTRLPQGENNIDPLKGIFLGETNCRADSYGTISIAANKINRGCLIAVRNQRKFFDALVCQIIPYNLKGPDYMKSVEFLVTEKACEQKIDIDTDRFDGLICILKMISQNGTYDTIEIFSPPKADWTCERSDNSVVILKSGERIYGRQQCKPTFTFDSSLCIVSPEQLTNTVENPNYSLMMLDKSCIVDDWVDYYSAAIFLHE